MKRLMGTAFSDSQVQKMRADSKAYPFGIKKPLGGLVKQSLSYFVVKSIVLSLLVERF